MSHDTSESSSSSSLPKTPSPLQCHLVDTDDDPQYVREYACEIFEYLRAKEVTERVHPVFLATQPEVTAKMRAILVDWMVDVCVKLRFTSVTLFTSVHIVDQYLSRAQVSRSELQLVGIAAMFISDKVEADWADGASIFRYVSDNTYTCDEIIECETRVLQCLDFHVHPAVAITFLRRFTKAARFDSRSYVMAKYICELALLEYKMLAFLPSMIAAACVYIGGRMTQQTGEFTWCDTLEHYTRYTFDEIWPCVCRLNKHVREYDHKKMRAVHRKYSTPRMFHVASVPTVDVSTFT